MTRSLAVAVVLLLTLGAPALAQAPSSGPTPTRTKVFDFDDVAVKGQLRKPDVHLIHARPRPALPPGPNALARAEAQLEQLQARSDPARVTAELLLRVGDLQVAVAERRWLEGLEAWEAAMDCHAAGNCNAPPADPPALDLRGAIQTYTRLVTQHPQATERPLATLRLADALEQPGPAHDDAAALRLRRHFAKTFPGHGEAAANLLAIAEHLFAQAQMAAALAAYQRVVAIGGPSHPLTPFAHYKSGWVHFNLGEPAKALGSFDAARRAASGPSRGALVAQVDRDLAMTFAQLPGDRGWRAAQAYFAKLGDPSATRTALERVAQHYRGAGRLRQALDVLDHLIAGLRLPDGRRELEQAREEVLRDLEGR